MLMRYMVCPQCGIRRFQVKDNQGNALVVQVNRDYEIVPVHDEESLEGYNLDILYCLGCSWKGSVHELKKYIL